MEKRELNFAESPVQVLKPARMDIPQVLPQSLALYETMAEEVEN